MKTRMLWFTIGALLGPQLFKLLAVALCGLFIIIIAGLDSLFKLLG